LAERALLRPDHARHGDAGGGGTHPRPEECAMPGRPHAEWRLLHAPVPRSPGRRPEGQAVPERIRAQWQRLHWNTAALTRVAMRELAADW